MSFTAAPEKRGERFRLGPFAPVMTISDEGLLLGLGGGVRNIRRAAQYWGEGETHLASIELALAGLPPLDDAKQASFRRC